MNSIRIDNAYTDLLRSYLVDIVHVLQDVAFSWDSQKAFSNLKRHGVPFEAACEIFFDPFVQVTEPETRGGESRQRAIGLTTNWRLLVVAFVFLKESIRIISARKATPLQRRRYEHQ